MAKRSNAFACLLVVLALGPSCATPCREAESRSDLRDFDQDHERCERQARKLAGNIDIGDYRSCMRVRGWCEAPK